MSSKPKPAPATASKASKDNENDNDSNKYCFLKVSLAGQRAQKIVIQLFRDVVPQTCHNFASLCQAPGRTTPSHPIPTYRGCIFHRIVPHFMVQGGDFEHFNGSGGYSILNNTKRTFADESFELLHNKAGLVSMANKGKDTNGSQFFITLHATPHLNQKHVVFGQVVQGMSVVQSMATDIELEGTQPTAMQKIVIVDCGIGTDNNNNDDKNDDSSTSVQNQEQKKRKRHHHHHHHDHKKKKHKKKHSHKEKKKHKKHHHHHHHHRRRDRSSSDDDSSDNSATDTDDSDKSSPSTSRDRKKSHKKESTRKRHHSSHSSRKRRKRHRDDSSNSSSSSTPSRDDDSRSHGRKR